MTKTTQIKNRTLLRLTGTDCVDFLQNLITCDVEKLQPANATFGALLTPQGKIMFDFFLVRESNDFLLEIVDSAHQDLLRRLNFYKLRADVTIEAVSGLKVFVRWDGPLEPGFPDPRLGELGARIYAPDMPINANEAEWNAHRIFLGVPESGSDFELGVPFPHEVLMDQFGKAGVDFTKGCYVGQEVVSRMQHRGTARSRWIKVEGDAVLPSKGTPLRADDRVIGTIGSSSGTQGLALVRLDRAKAAMDTSIEITAENVGISLQLAKFTSLDWPS